MDPTDRRATRAATPWPSGSWLSARCFFLSMRAPLTTTCSLAFASLRSLTVRISAAVAHLGVLLRSHRDRWRDGAQQARTGSLLGPAVASAKYRAVRNVKHSSGSPDTGDFDDSQGRPLRKGVAGSSPAEGFIGTPRYGGDSSFPVRPRPGSLSGYWSSRIHVGPRARAVGQGHDPAVGDRSTRTRQRRGSTRSTSLGR